MADDQEVDNYKSNSIENNYEENSDKINLSPSHLDNSAGRSSMADNQEVDDKSNSIEKNYEENSDKINLPPSHLDNSAGRSSMADSQEVDNDKSNSIENNYEENSDKIKEGLGGNLKVDTDEEVEIIKEADQFPKLDDQKDYVDLMESLKEWPVKDWRGQRSKLTASTSEDHQIHGSVDPVKLARQLLKRMENIDESEPANRISKAKTFDTNPFYKSGHGKADGHSVESRSNGMVLHNGSPVTPKHPKPVTDSGTEPQPKKYRCSICGKYFPTFQAMGGHKGRHRNIEDW